MLQNSSVLKQLLAVKFSRRLFFFYLAQFRFNDSVQFNNTVNVAKFINYKMTSKAKDNRIII